MTAVAAPAARRAARARTAQPAMPARQRLRWGVTDLVIIAWTLFPVWWLVSLSFKDPTTLSDGSFWPQKWSWANYSGSSTARRSSSR